MDETRSNELLMLAVGKGDLDAFDELVRRNQDWAWGVAYRFLGNQDEAEDVVQEAFIRLLDAAERYQPKSLFRTYFFRIISRICLDKAKRQKSIPLEDVPFLPDPEPNADTILIDREKKIAVRDALNTLPPNQRMAIVLRYYEGLNYMEIAEALRTTIKSVERLLARGRDHLHSILYDLKN